MRNLSSSTEIVSWIDNFRIFRSKMERILKFSFELEEGIYERQRGGGEWTICKLFRKSFLEMLKNISKRGRKEEADGGSVAFVLHRSFTGPRVADNILTSFKSNEVYTHETRLKRGTHRLGPAHRCTSQAVPIHLIHAPLKKFYSVRFQPSSSPSSFAR